VDIKEYMTNLGQQARRAGREISRAESGKKNRALLEIAKAIQNRHEVLLAENRKDLESGKKTVWIRRCWTDWN
jgi:glutamate-5-semialdehyde dehydrogenase